MAHVLISGAGIAGATTAYWLSRRFDVTVVEQARGVRSSGSPVDVRGPAVEVAERMGVMGRLREADTGVRNMVFVDSRGKVTCRIDVRSAWSDPNDVEIPRGDLAEALRDAIPSGVEVEFGNSITNLEHCADGVLAQFETGAPRRFDLVVGADGMHSAVRRLVFGPETEFVTHLGVYVATVSLPGEASRNLVMFNEPGRSVVIHPARGRAIAAFMFRAPQVRAFDHRDTDRHRELLTAAYAGAGWRVPELLDRVRTADDLYFDSVSRVHVPAWSRGGVTLVGDAAACVSLFGDGSSLAMTGAFTLADSLDDDATGGLRSYEARHRPRTDAKEGGVKTATRLFVPASRAGIGVRNVAVRAWSLMDAAQRQLRRPVSLG